ncbi:MAG: hypothetical protein IID13_08815 [Candidatus Marinimicrobia bacterium]|nr:hypothetical protein [Candidatus Neomarinimicrobiota bacterium]
MNLEPGALTFDMGAGYQGSGVCSKMDSTFMTALDKIGYYDMTGDNLTLRDSQDGYVLYFTDK